MPSYTTDTYTINTREAPFDDIRVRKAMSLSVDREAAVQVVVGGNGIVTGFLQASPWGHTVEEIAKLASYGGDIEARREEARALLAEAGHPNGFSARLTVCQGAGTHEARAVFLADQFSKIGVQVELNLLESAAYFDALRAGSFQIATTGFASLINDPDFLLGDYHTCNGTANFTGGCGVGIDDLFSQQSQEVDPVKRRELARQAELIALNEFTNVSQYMKIKNTLVSKQVKNYVVHPEQDNNRRL